MHACSSNNMQAEHEDGSLCDRQSDALMSFWIFQHGNEGGFRHRPYPLLKKSDSEQTEISY